MYVVGKKIYQIVHIDYENCKLLCYNFVHKLLLDIFEVIFSVFTLSLNIFIKVFETHGLFYQYYHLGKRDVLVTWSSKLLEQVNVHHAGWDHAAKPANELCKICTSKYSWL